MINISKDLTASLSEKSRTSEKNSNNTGEEFSKVLSKGFSLKDDDHDKKSVKDKIKSNLLTASGQYNVKEKSIKDEKIVKDDSPKYKYIDKKNSIKDNFTDEEIAILSQFLGVSEVKIQGILENVTKESCNVADIGMAKFDLLELILKKISTMDITNNEVGQDITGIENMVDMLFEKDLEGNKLLFEFFKNASKDDMVTFVKDAAKKAEGLVNITIWDENQTQQYGTSEESVDFLLQEKNNMSTEIWQKPHLKTNEINENKTLIMDDGAITYKETNSSNSIISRDELNLGKLSEAKGSYENEFLKSLATTKSKDTSSMDDSKISHSIDKLNTLMDFKNFTQWNDNNDVPNIHQGDITITKESMALDMVKSIRLMNLSNMKELTLKVVPKELGELIITVSMEDGILKANIKASTKEAYDLIQSNMETIKEKLNMENTKVQQFSVDIYDKNSTTGNSQNFGNNQDMNQQSRKRMLSNKEVDMSNDTEETENILESNYDVLNMLA